MIGNTTLLRTDGSAHAFKTLTMKESYQIAVELLRTSLKRNFRVRNTKRQKLLRIGSITREFRQIEDKQCLGSQ